MDPDDEEWYESDQEMDGFDDTYVEHRSISPKVQHNNDSPEESQLVDECKENTLVWLVQVY